MFLFKKNEPKGCNHKWKDFPWYIRYGERQEGDSYYTRKRIYFFDVYEPYVCVKCKERRDEKLGGFESDDEELRDKKLKEIEKKYQENIKGRIGIEDMIKDEQLVDREYLKLIEEFENPTDRFESLDLFAEIQKAKKDAGVPPGIAVQIGG